MSVTDTFAVDDLATNWTVAGSSWSISSGTLNNTGATGTAAGLHYSGATWANNQSSQALDVGGNNYWAVGVRLSGTSQATFNGYVYFSHGEIQKVTNGGNSSLAAGGGGIGAGTTAKLDATGTTLQASQNGSNTLSTTDGTFSSGNPGVALYANSAALSWDDWVGTGEIVAGQVPYQPLYLVAPMMAQ